MTARTFTFTVSEAPSVGTPTWFSEMAPLEWRPIADGTGAAKVGGSTLQQVTYQNTHVWPSPSTAIGRPRMNSASNYCQNSNGAAVDPVNAEMFLVSNGGHGGYMGNETMRLQLRAEKPSWEIFVDSTPPDYFPPAGTNPGETNTAAYWSEEVYLQGNFAWQSYLDGPAYPYPVTTGPVTRRPASTHTSCLEIYSEGKVWFPVMSSTNLNGGFSSVAKYALNVQSVRDNPALKNWTYGNIAPWEFHGMQPTDCGITQGHYLMSGSALDPSTGRIWTPCASASFLTNRIIMMETRGPNAGRHQYFNNTVSNRIGTGQCPRIITVTDTTGATKKLLVTMTSKDWDTDLNRYVIVIDLSLLEAQNITYSGFITLACATRYAVDEPTPLLWWGPERVANDPNGRGPGAGWGMIYHAPSKAFFAFNCDQCVNTSRVRHGALRKLSLPLNAAGRYDPVNFNWTWTEVPIGGVVPTTCSPTGYITGGSWSRFNVIPEFDGVNDLVISLNSYNTATSVMKLPPQAL
jgi:hypothetical protein